MDTEDYIHEPYTCILVPDSTGGYAAAILEWPGCFAEGDTANTAMAALGRAAAAWKAAALTHGQAIPLPLSTEGYGGRIALRVSKSLHRQAVQRAAQEGVSLNQFLAITIAKEVGAHAAQAQQARSQRGGAVTTRILPLTVQYASHSVGTMRT